MMYSAKAAALAVAMLAGARAQDVGTDIAGRECTGEAIQIDYQNCGRFGSMNVYWTYLEANGQLNILFETMDDGYASFGFTDPNEGNPMDGANVVLGCQDWNVPDLPEVFQILLPGPGEERSVPNVAAGIGADNLQPGNLLQERLNGICGMRFERLSLLPDINNVVGEGQNILSGTPNQVVWARGAAGAVDPARHDSRGAGLQDFILADGDISAAATVPLLGPDGQPQPEVTPLPTDGELDNSSSVATLSSMVAGAVAALAAALW